MSEKTTKEQENELLNFNWEEVGIDVEDTMEDSGEETPDDTSEKEEEEVVVEELSGEEADENFFNGDEDSELPVTAKPKAKANEGIVEKGVNESIFTSVYKDLKDRGLLRNVEIDEDEDLDAERFYQLQEEDYEREVYKRINDWAKNELDADAQAFIKFKKAGGNTADFLKTLSKTESVSGGDLNDMEYQDYLIRQKLSAEGLTADDVEEALETMTPAVKKKTATLYKQKLDHFKERERQRLLYEQEMQRQRRIQEEHNFREDLRYVLQDRNEIVGHKLKDKDRNEIYNYLTNRNIRISDKQVLTGFQRDLANAFKDTDKLVVLAKILHSDFDFSKLEKRIETSKTRQIKSNIEGNSRLGRNRSGSTSKSSGLYDLF